VPYYNIYSIAKTLEELLEYNLGNVLGIKFPKALLHAFRSD